MVRNKTQNLKDLAHERKQERAARALYKRGIAEIEKGERMKERAKKKLHK
jgi:hypothetical protein